MSTLNRSGFSLFVIFTSHGCSGLGGGGGFGPLKWLRTSKSRRLVCRVKAVIGFSGKVCDGTGSFSIRCQFLCNRHVIFGL